MYDLEEINLLLDLEAKLRNHPRLKVLHDFVAGELIEHAAGNRMIPTEPEIVND